MRDLPADDITAIFLTLNRMPPGWTAYHMTVLKSALGSIPVISISRLPMNFGTNLIDEGPHCYVNYYRQLLRGAMAATTKYIAAVEDDTLYHESHFRRVRPADDEFAYNRARWSIFSWGEALYSLRNRISNCSCIAPRQLMVDALTERLSLPRLHEGMMGECGRNDMEERLGVTLRKKIDFFSRVPLVQLSHEGGTESRQKDRKKSHAEIRAYDIPHWGKAADLLKHYDR
jgi:hypothetical protein